MIDNEYWIWLQRAYGTGAKIKPIIEYFGSARGVYEAGSYEWRLSGLIDSKHEAKLVEHSPSESGKIMRMMYENSWDIINPSDSEYPFCLRQISDFPAVLYACGDILTLMQESMIAIVGTRNASMTAIKTAEFISERLALSGLTVVSGGALGIDTAAHNGAMNVDKKTIAVLGCGLGNDYLRANEELRKRIALNGILLTEYPPFTPASRYSFPKRNRIISGLSLGTVIIEAGERSGSLITAKYALEQEKDLYAVPSELIFSAKTGTDTLIKSSQAKAVYNPVEIVGNYVDEFPNRFKPDLADRPIKEMLEGINLSALKAPEKSVERGKKAKSEAKRETEKSENNTEKPSEESTELTVLPETASENARKIYDTIEGTVDFDTIVLKCGLPVVKVLSGITELELYSVIEALPGKNYKKI